MKSTKSFFSFLFSCKLNSVKIFAVFVMVVLFSGSSTFFVDAAFVGSPNFQLKSGVAPEDVVCRDNLVLVLRANGDPVCVTNISAEKLGWEIVSDDDLIFEESFPVEIITKTITNQTKIISVEYTIKNGNITNITDNGKCSLLLDLDSWDDGNLQIKIPREIIDSKNQLVGHINDSEFLGLSNGILYEILEIKTTLTHRTLDINFTNNVKIIEILGTLQWDGTC